MAINHQDMDRAFFDIRDLLSDEQIIEDYRIAYGSRQVSLIGRKEVLGGRAKFGAFGDGKEVPQVALAHFYNKGDFRSGYYRDQTLMFALGELSIRGFFAQLYAHADVEAEPASGGRMMNAHFATRLLDSSGKWRNLTEQYNTSADISPTAGQMPRLTGLAYASKLYRELDELKQFGQFSDNGNEVAFGMIGNASAAEGHFWEAINAIGVLGAPAVISIWDDGYGISVTNEHQMTKGNISALLEGFQQEGDGKGYNVYTVPGWHYLALVATYYQAVQTARESHTPAIIHVTEVTQPQGHSTSGSHERYKSEDRLQWEADHDCIKHMREWIIAEGIATEDELEQIESETLAEVRAERKAAWNAYVRSITDERDQVEALIAEVAANSEHATELEAIRDQMTKPVYPKRKDYFDAIHEALLLTINEDIPARRNLIQWRDEHKARAQERYSTSLYSETDDSPMRVAEVKPVYSDKPQKVAGFTILNNYFDSMLAGDPRVITFGEDVGYLGGVNQTMAGMQEKYGKLRVSDTGIRETTIIGQAIGMAMRGLRPVAEIQYLDYLFYALQTMADDLATVRWRTAGGQKAPVIIRTRGHRLEGVWHSGSPMGAILNMVRGIHVLVPRDMTRAAGFYNTLLQGDDPGLVVEVLNGYRKKEPLPDNLANITVPLGVPEILREGRDVTLVTYGAMCRIAIEAADDLSKVGIEVEVIDVQSLLPFDIHGHIVESLKKTNRILFTDEDVPGGATAYMMQEVLEKQGGYHWLDSKPRTLTSQAHRPAYGTDGDYFSKPNKHAIFSAIYDMMNEANPARYPIAM